jgi:hypothetical protein
LSWLISHRTPAGTNDETAAAAQAASWRAGITNGDSQRVFVEAFNSVMTSPRSFLENQAQLIVDSLMTNYASFRTFNITNLAPGDFTADFLYFRAFGAAKASDMNTYFSCLKAYTWLAGASGDRDNDIQTLMDTYGAPPPSFTFTATPVTQSFTYRKDVPFSSYIIEQTTNLLNNTWKPLPSDESTNTDGTFTQTIPNDGSNVKFFRMARF